MHAPRSCASPSSATRISAVACASARARWHGLHGRPEELGERGEPDASDPALEQPSRKPDRVDDGRCEPSSGQSLDLDVEEADVEAGVVGDEDGVAGEIEEPAHGELGRRRAPKRGGLDPRQRRDRSRQGPPRVHERLERLCELEPADPHGADLADRRRRRGEARSSRGRRRHMSPARAAPARLADRRDRPPRRARRAARRLRPPPSAARERDPEERGAARRAFSPRPRAVPVRGAPGRARRVDRRSRRRVARLEPRRTYVRLQARKESRPGGRLSERRRSG